MGDLLKLKDLVFESDNRACFIERERILTRLEKEMKDYSSSDRYAVILSKLLAEVSTPILDCDYFAGRAVEALPDEGMKAPCLLLFSSGHMSFDYEKVLKIGLKGILAEIRTAAAQKNDTEALSFSKNAEIVITAIRDFTARYAIEAKRQGRLEMARALSRVPFEPAYDFYSALSGIWILHMIASCYVGARDYAFGKFDSYMLPFYQQALRDGKSKEELTDLLAGFLVKTNEICGRHTHNYKQKPVLCQASKQYINIGGEKPNEFSYVVLEAAKLLNMAQPQIVVLLKPDADEAFTSSTFEALSVLTDKMHIYNYGQIADALLKKGLPQEIAKDFTYSACCSFDLNFHSFRHEYYAPIPFIFVETLCKREYISVRQIIAEFKEALICDFQKYVDTAQKGYDDLNKRKRFVLDSLFLSDSAKEARYACDGNAKYNVLNIFCPGIATIGDSLMVTDRLVFQEKRFSYAEFMEIVKNDFLDHEPLRQEILCFTRFGNDTDTDDYTTLAGNTILDAIDCLKLKDNFYVAPGFYSLERENTWKHKLSATPDGRRSGDPFSENQSPTYGADKSGMTALLNSLAKLPLERTVCGGLNLTFSKRVTPEVLKTLVITYFEKGGLHVGIGIINSDTLRDAMKHPDKYKSLTVRLYGFSEYFVNLPEWQQLALLQRTQYE